MSERGASLQVGTSVVVMGRLCDVVTIAPTGDVQVRDVISMELRWYDYYSFRMLNPHENPEAVLIALSLLEKDEVVRDPIDGQADEEEARRPPTEGGEAEGLSLRWWRRSDTSLSEEGAGRERPSPGHADPL